MNFTGDEARLETLTAIRTMDPHLARSTLLNIATVIWPAHLHGEVDTRTAYDREELLAQIIRYVWDVASADRYREEIARVAGCDSDMRLVSGK